MTSPPNDDTGVRPAPPPAGHPAPPGGYPAPPGGYPAPPPGGYSPPASAPPPLGPGGQPLADFGERLLATIIDTVILVAIQLAVALPLFVLAFARLFVGLEYDADGDLVDPTFADVVLPWLLLFAALIVLGLLLTYLYEVEFVLRRGGRTVGKQVMKLRIVPVEPAAVLDRGALVRRWLVACVATTFVPTLWYIDGLWQLVDRPYRQCLHDKFGRTIVVRDAR